MFKYLLIVSALILAGCSNYSSVKLPEDVNLKMSEHQIGIRGGQMPPQGWQPGFSNSLQLFLDNPLDQKVDFYDAQYRFVLNGKDTKFSGSFVGETPLTPKGGSAQEYCPVFLPAELADSGTNLALRLKVFAKNNDIKITGTRVLPIVISNITSDFKVVKGKHVSLEMSKESFANIDKTNEIVDLLDQAYVAMADLIGIEPGNGQMMALRESPARGFYGRAGYPILLNSLHARKDFKDFNDGAVSFVWLHEMGHNFEYGYWYMYNHPCCEFHANFKLIYAIETLFPTPDTNNFFKLYRWGKVGEGRPTFATGKEWVDDQFIKSNPKYVSDPSKPWDTADLMEIYLDVVRGRGWEPFKHMYRTYNKMNEIGTPKPDVQSAEEKLGLQLSILSLSMGDDIIEYCQKWGIPLTQEKVNGFIKKYDLEQHRIKK